MQGTAKALVLQKANKLRLQEAPYEVTRPDGVIVKTIASAITPGLDRLLLTNKSISTRVLNYPIMPGSEAIGQVLEVGPEVEDLAPGDFVYAFRAEGWKGIEPYYGCHAELLPTARPNVLPLGRQPVHRDLLTGLLAYALSAVDKAAPKPDQRILVLGLGSVGLMVSEYLHSIGCHNVDAVETFGIRGQLSRCGTIAIEIGDFPAEFNNSYDLVIETTGRVLLLEKAIRLLKPQAKMLLMGNYEVMGWDYRFIQEKEPQIICSSLTTIEHLRRASRLLDEGALDAEKFFTNIFPVAEFERAYRMALDSKESIKTVLVWI